MKKIGIWLLTGTLLMFGVIFADNDKGLFERAYEKGLVSFENDLYAEDDLNRGQFSWIILKYLENVAKKEYQAGNCKAEDLYNASPLHQEALKKVCEYGIMKGEKNRLYPLWKLTNAQALAVVMRIVDSRQQESTEGGKHRALNYYNRADQLGYATSPIKTIKNAPISYRNMLKLLYSTENSSGYDSTPSTIKRDDPLKNLYDIVHQAPAEQSTQPKTSCNPDYAGRWLNRLNSYDELCKEGNIKSFSEYRTERRWECESKDKSQTISCQANKQNTSETNTTTSTNDNKAGCNTNYHRKTQDSLAARNQLCEYGKLRDFKTQTRGWTWNCVSNNQNTHTSCWTEKTARKTTIEKAECWTAINTCQKGQALNMQETSKGRLWTCRLDSYQEQCGRCKSGYNRSEAEKACVSTNNWNNNTWGSSWGSSWWGGNGGNSNWGTDWGNSWNNNWGASWGTEWDNTGTQNPVARPEECFSLDASSCNSLGCYIRYNSELNCSKTYGTHIIIPATIQNKPVIGIHNYWFYYPNPKLTWVTFPNTIKDIWYGAFDSQQLTSLTLPKELTTIWDKAFIRNKIETIKIPSKVKTIWDNAFSRNQIKTLDIWDWVPLTIGSSFSVNKLESLHIPNRAVSIGSHAFSDNLLTNLTFEENSKLHSVWNYAFMNNCLKAVKLPSSVKNLGEKVFRNNCFESENAFVYARNPNWTENKKIIVGYWGKKGGAITIPEGVEVIEKNALSNLWFTAITFPRTIKQIGTGAFSDNKISSIDLPPNIKEIKKLAFSANLLTALTIPEGVSSIWRSAFSSNDIRTLKLPSTLQTIESYAFSLNELTTLNIPENVQTIGSWAFSNNYIEHLSIPTTTQVAPSAFNMNYIKDEQEFVYERSETGEKNKKVLIGRWWGRTSRINIPNSVEIIGTWAFIWTHKREGKRENSHVTYLQSIDTLTIPDSVKIIKPFAFKNVTFGKAPNLPNGLIEIGEQAFANDSSYGWFYRNGIDKVDTINIPDSLQKIGKNAFCSALYGNAAWQVIGYVSENKDINSIENLDSHLVLRKKETTNNQ